MNRIKFLSNFQVDRNSELSKIYNQYYEQLFMQGVRLGYSHEQVKDLIQQMFLSFAEKRVRFGNLKNVEAFVVTCFKRKLIDYHRSQQAIKNRFTAISEELANPEYSNMLEENEDRLSLSLKIKNVYDNLAPRYQDIIFYKYGMGLTNEEIAQKTGLSIQTIYNNLHNAIKIIRKKFLEH